MPDRAEKVRRDQVVTDLATLVMGSGQGNAERRAQFTQLLTDFIVATHDLQIAEETDLARAAADAVTMALQQ
jgi:hypothetical protein